MEDISVLLYMYYTTLYPSSEKGHEGTFAS
jgi:hypothetical protein